LAAAVAEPCRLAKNFIYASGRAHDFSAITAVMFGPPKKIASQTPLERLDFLTGNLQQDILSWLFTELGWVHQRTKAGKTFYKNNKSVEEVRALGFVAELLRHADGRPVMLIYVSNERIMAPRKEACYFYLSKYYLKSHETAVLIRTVVLVEAEGAGPVSVIPEAHFNIEDFNNVSEVQQTWVRSFLPENWPFPKENIFDQDNRLTKFTSTNMPAPNWPFPVKAAGMVISISKKDVLSFSVPSNPGAVQKTIEAEARERSVRARRLAFNRAQAAYATESSRAADARATPTPPPRPAFPAQNAAGDILPRATNETDPLDALLSYNTFPAHDSFWGVDDFVFDPNVAHGWDFIQQAPVLGAVTQGDLAKAGAFRAAAALLATLAACSGRTRNVFSAASNTGFGFALVFLSRCQTTDGHCCAPPRGRVEGLKTQKTKRYNSKNTRNRLWTCVFDIHWPFGSWRVVHNSFVAKIL
jgi:hypothetical protein